MSGGEQSTLDHSAAAHETAPERSRWMCCRICGNPIAPVSGQTSFDGGHSHRFSNPGGLEFVIELYADAPGCRAEGECTEFYSWFPGYAWRVAVCRACLTHLGWAFACVGPAGLGEPDSFYGLIANRLRNVG